MQEFVNAILFSWVGIQGAENVLVGTLYKKIKNIANLKK